MAAEQEVPRRAVPALLGWPATALPLGVKVSLLLLVAGSLILVGLAGSRAFPTPQDPDTTEFQGQIADIFHDPAVKEWDRTLLGDLLVERFYIVDLVTGERYVADLLKGRIDGIEVVPREDQPHAAVFLLKSRDMRRDKAFYNAYLKAVTEPEELPARYLGAVMPTGDSDAFPVNYTGEIPPERYRFLVGEDDDAFSYAVRQDPKEITSPRGINVYGYIYVLSTSDLLPVFRTEFGLGKTAFVSELLVVDTTSRENKTTYYRLLDQYPRATTP